MPPTRFFFRVRRSPRTLLKDGRSPSTEGLRRIMLSKIQHAEGESPPRIVTVRGAARGSYLESLPQLFFKFVTLLQILPPIRQKSIPKLVQILPRPSQIFPKASQILRKIDPKSIQKPFWSQFWINALQKLDFERP